MLAISPHLIDEEGSLQALSLIVFQALEAKMLSLFVFQALQAKLFIAHVIFAVELLCSFCCCSVTILQALYESGDHGSDQGADVQLLACCTLRTFGMFRSYLHIIAADSTMARGFAMSCPAMSGALP